MRDIVRIEETAFYIKKKHITDFHMVNKSQGWQSKMFNARPWMSPSGFTIWTESQCLIYCFDSAMKATTVPAYPSRSLNPG